MNIEVLKLKIVEHLLLDLLVEANIIELSILKTKLSAILRASGVRNPSSDLLSAQTVESLKKTLKTKLDRLHKAIKEQEEE